MAETDSGVDPWDEEPLAPAAGECPQRRFEPDVELQLHLPGEGGLLLGGRRVGVGERYRRLGQEPYQRGRAFLGLPCVHSERPGRKVLTVSRSA